MPKELNLYFHNFYLYFYDVTTQLQHMICIHYSFFKLTLNMETGLYIQLQARIQQSRREKCV